MIKSIETVNAPQAIGPYSQAIAAGPMVFVSGQLPIDPRTGEIPPSIEAQTHQTLQNLGNILNAVNCNLSQVAKTTVFLATMEDFPIVNRIYADYFQKNCPARSTVEVSRLPKDARVEIDAIAYRVPE